MNYAFERFQAFLGEFLTDESALLTAEGEVLGVQGKNPITYGTLPTATQITHKYLQLKAGDIALLNDPYSGGGVLSDYTFIVALTPDLLWATRRSLNPSIQLSKSIEEEGLRIPPTPIYHDSKINEMILAAIEAHPNCPINFVNWLKGHCQNITLQRAKFLNALKLSNLNLNKDFFRSFLEVSKKTAVQKVSERSSGDARVEITLDSGELLRLNLEIHDGQITMNFSGTSAPQTISLTESATFGACFEAISRFYDFNPTANSGSLSVLHLSKPAGCWLIGKYPSPTYKGMTTGVAALQYAIELALFQIHQKQKRSALTFAPIFLDLQHNNNTQHLKLLGGLGARFEPFSIEQLEKEFPIQLLQADQRPQVEEANALTAGRGLTIKLKIKSKMRTTWLTEFHKKGMRSQKNLTEGPSAEIFVETNGAIENLPPAGLREILEGETLTVSSGAGGVYGES